MIPTTMTKSSTVASMTLICLILSACLPYVPPTDSDLATLTFRNLSDERSFGYGFIFQFHEHCEGMRITRYLSRGRSTTERVRAGKPLSFGMHYSLIGDPESYDACSAIAMLTPKKDADYEAVITGGSDDCYLRVFELQGNKRVKADIVIRDRLRVPARGRARHCAPM